MRQWTPYEKTQLLRANRADLLEKITDETPVEYLVGQVNFCGWNVQISPAVLIPRVETEDLVEHCFAEVMNLLANKKTLTIVEVGTGSGAIGLSLWQKLNLNGLRNHCEINLFDISDEALTITGKNLKQLLDTDFSVEFLPRLQQMDLLSDWPPESKIDVLIANLPYIPTARLETLDKSVIDYEPKLALDGGKDGFVLIQKLLEQAEKSLANHGVIWLEVDHTHSLEKFQEFSLPFQYQSLLDCFEKPRFIRVVRC